MDLWQVDKYVVIKIDKCRRDKQRIMEHILPRQDYGLYYTYFIHILYVYCTYLFIYVYAGRTNVRFAHLTFERCEILYSWY